MNTYIKLTIAGSGRILAVGHQYAFVYRNATITKRLPVSGGSKTFSYTLAANFAVKNNLRLCHADDPHQPEQGCHRDPGPQTAMSRPAPLQRAGCDLLGDSMMDRIFGRGWGQGGWSTSTYITVIKTVLIRQFRPGFLYLRSYPDYNGATYQDYTGTGCSQFASYYKVSMLEEQPQRWEKRRLSRSLSGLADFRKNADTN